MFSSLCVRGERTFCVDGGFSHDSSMARYPICMIFGHNSAMPANDRYLIVPMKIKSENVYIVLTLNDL